MYNIINKCIILFYTFFAIFANATTGPNHGKIVVCYLANWSVYRSGRGSFAIENLDPSLCTHIVYAFVGLDIINNNIRSRDAWQDLTDDFGNGGFNRVVALKDINPNVKVTVGLGGWEDGSKNYSILAADPVRRSKFVINALDFVRKYKFDGLEIDWESPGKRGGSSYDKKNFLSLIIELRNAFDEHNLLLTATLGANKDTINLGYDVKNLSRYLDYVYLKTFDYHGPWDEKTGANSPLLSDDEDNIEFSVKHMIKLGMEPSKLVLGIPLNGRTFYLTDEAARTLNRKDPKLGVESTPTGFEGLYSDDPGFIGYNEICVEFQSNPLGWSQHWDKISQTPFAINFDKVISYENEKSLNLKIDFAMKEKLGGVMVWYIDNDDFLGDCSVPSGSDDQKIINKFPLMKIINKAIIRVLFEIEDAEAEEIRSATKDLFICPAISVWCK